MPAAQAADMRATASPIHILLLAWCLFLPSSYALTLEELRSMPNLTPKKFASLFKDFKFQFRTEVQDPRVFLATRTGDCDDYATLAAAVLKEHGYTPRLITIRMPRLVHVVCYIEETQSYLDYDNRGYFSRTVSCGQSLEEIAAKVARANDRSWISASEFTFDDGVKRLVKTVVEPKSVQPVIAGVSN